MQDVTPMTLMRQLAIFVVRYWNIYWLPKTIMFICTCLSLLLSRLMTNLSVIQLFLCTVWQTGYLNIEILSLVVSFKEQKEKEDFFGNFQMIENDVFSVLLRVCDKENILSPHEESNLRPVDSMLQCSTTKLQRLHGEQGLLQSSCDTCPTNC